MLTPSAANLSGSSNQEAKQWIEAAREGRDESMAQLLKESPNLIVTVDNQAKTALHWAAANGHSAAVALLLVENSDLINAVDNKGKTAMYRAAKHGHAGIAELCFAANPNSIRNIDSQGWTVLHIAAERNLFLFVERALVLWPDLIEAVDLAGKTALDVAIDMHCMDVVARILVENPSLKSRREHFGALHYAVRYGYSKGVARLLAQDPNAVNLADDQGMTVLHDAAQWGDPEIMARLLALASPRIINANCTFLNTTALHFAAYTRHYEVVGQLLDVMSSDAISAPDIRGTTVLHLAARHGHVQTVGRLLADESLYADMIDEVIGMNGFTALHEAVNHGQEIIAEMLLAKRPELAQILDKSRETALHYAARNCDGQLCRQFHERLLGLNPSALHAVNTRGQTPFRLAVEALNEVVIEVMLMKMSLDEVANLLPKDQRSSYEERFLRPELERQCGCLLDVLNQDVGGLVCDYLGLDFLQRHTKYVFAK